METGVIVVLVSIWVLLLVSASIVTLLPGSRPGRESDVISLGLRRRRNAGDRTAA